MNRRNVQPRPRQAHCEMLDLSIVGVFNRKVPTFMKPRQALSLTSLRKSVFSAADAVVAVQPSSCFNFQVAAGTIGYLLTKLSFTTLDPGEQWGENLPLSLADRSGALIASLFRNRVPHSEHRTKESRLSHDGVHPPSWNGTCMA